MEAYFNDRSNGRLKMSVKETWSYQHQGQDFTFLFVSARDNISGVVITQDDVDPEQDTFFVDGLTYLEIPDASLPVFKTG